MIEAYKLFTVRKDGTLGSLFINRRRRIPIGVWLEAESYPTKGYKLRPYWHCTVAPSAPHLTMNGREWHKVLIKGVTVMQRPQSQGGTWYLADQLKVLDQDGRNTMDLVVDQRITGKPSLGIAIYDNDSPGPPLLVIENEHDIENLECQLYAWIKWSRVAKNVVDADEDQMPESYGGTK